jgi:hypothetical protein
MSVIAGVCHPAPWLQSAMGLELLCKRRIEPCLVAHENDRATAVTKFKQPLLVGGGVARSIRRVSGVTDQSSGRAGGLLSSFFWERVSYLIV